MEELDPADLITQAVVTRDRRRFSTFRQEERYRWKKLGFRQSRDYLKPLSPIEHGKSTGPLVVQPG